MSPMFVSGGSVAAAGMAMSVFSGSWVGCWLGLEVNLLGFMVVMNHPYIKIEASVKYFVVQSLGSGFLIMGFLSSEISESLLFCDLFLIFSFLLKSGLVPFHFWVPSVVNSLSWVSGFLMLTFQKLGALVLVGWFVSEKMLVLSACASALIGGVGGLNQTSVRAMLAYSSFVHSGWMLLGLVGSFSLFLFYWSVYSFSVFCVYWSCAVLDKKFFKSKSRGLVSCVGLLLLTGLPPFLGFIPKVMVFMSFNNAAVFLCVLGSLLSLKYYLSFFFSFFLSGTLFNASMGNSGVLLGVTVFYGNFLSFLGFILLLLS
nr:NADH dehydrogenase subunit 2 [Semimytilus algosus]